jgi:hypothetical protein
MNFIKLEVSKLLKAKRVSDQTLIELDSRVAIEVYLRQKKDAILEDKKTKERDPDVESKLSVVQ